MTLADVLREHPDLSAYGFKTDALSAEKHAAGREVTPEFEAQFEAARIRLSNARAIASAKRSSYLVKHILERMAQRYISNGACIAAAYAVGMPVGTEHLGISLNALLGIDQRDLRRWDRYRWPLKT
ncbi:hypothetical protein [Parasphingorhabdus sp.]|uniref:hypothetical protein n=1 Tax=Parasphingorhabdus sp. TaxID=2709688 RepID=UPI003A8DF549